MKKNIITNFYLYSNDFHQLPDSMINLTNLTALVMYSNSQLGDLSSVERTKNSNMNYNTGKDMTIAGNGTTIDITVN